MIAVSLTVYIPDKAERKKTNGSIMWPFILATLILGTRVCSDAALIRISQ